MCECDVPVSVGSARGVKDVDELAVPYWAANWSTIDFQAARRRRVEASREFRDRVAGIGKPRDLGGGRAGRRSGLEARRAGHHPQAGQFPSRRSTSGMQP